MAFGSLLGNIAGIASEIAGEAQADAAAAAAKAAKLRQLSSKRKTLNTKKKNLKNRKTKVTEAKRELENAESDGSRVKKAISSWDSDMGKGIKGVDSIGRLRAIMTNSDFDSILNVSGAIDKLTSEELRLNREIASLESQINSIDYEIRCL